MEFIAHIRSNDHQIQTVEEHLLEVKKIAEDIGAKIGVKKIAGLAGMLHDLGKYSKVFKHYILAVVENPDSAPKRGSVDHSTAGGKLLYSLFHTGEPKKYEWILSEIVGNAVISHHSYLQDFIGPDLESDYLKRVRDKEVEEFEISMERFFDKVISRAEFNQYVKDAAKELEDFLNRESSLSNESKLMFLSKFIFSALIDADRTNSRMFDSNLTFETTPDSRKLFENYYKKLQLKLHELQNKSHLTEIDKLRMEMSEQCEGFAMKPSGIYTLSIPTGGGKTLASFRYALKHAMLFNKKRIIYIVPFTTIIEQNAEEIRKIIQDDENLLEHHSNVIIDEIDTDFDLHDTLIMDHTKWNLAKDNWDIPIIFTTMVQFLNVFYARGGRYIRRLHNLSDSVIVFDEVQKVPTHCVSLFNQALNFLSDYCNSSMLLCTATQPALDYVEYSLKIEKDSEIIGDLPQIVSAFKRVEIIDYATNTAFNNDNLAEFVTEQIQEVRSVLVILNTKAVVKNLYRKLKDALNVPVYHLSTAMCAAHRQKKLESIRKHLNDREPVICISTQLIEAGVDISFQTVIRSLTGLDSIAQAAGRCNRHGEDPVRYVYIIDHAEENLSRLPEIREGKEITKRLLRDLQLDPSLYRGDLLSVEAMSKYFKEFYYKFKSELNYPINKLQKNMVQLLVGKRNDPDSYYQSYRVNKKEELPLFLTQSYMTAAEHFEAIKNEATSVLVPYANGKDIIAELGGANPSEQFSNLLRRAQRYTINIFSHEFKVLEKNGGIVGLMDGRILALKESAYNEDYGLDIQNESGYDLTIF